MSLLALIPAAMHSSPRFKGKLTEKVGTQSLRSAGSVPMTAGLPARTLDDPHPSHPRVQFTVLRGQRIVFR